MSTDSAKLIQVICTTLTRYGDGSELNPIRIITQYWSIDGELLAEVDPHKETEFQLTKKKFNELSERMKFFGLSQ